MEIKRSMGLKRSKTDKQDAQEIEVRYAWLRRNELESSIPMPLNLIDFAKIDEFKRTEVKQTTALKKIYVKALK